MIYTLGCSATNFIWPTWSDWLQVYQGPVTKLAFSGSSNDNLFVELSEKIKTFTPKDKIYIMWTQNHRINLWYDLEWIDQKDCLGFFPNTNGHLWYTRDVPYMGMYRTHPDYQTSFTNMLVNQFMTIAHTQLLLDKYNIDYTMTYTINPWADCRPVFKPKYTTNWHRMQGLTEQEINHAQQLISIGPVRKLLEEIDWSKFIDSPKDISDPNAYQGLCDYYFAKKEYILLKHDTDHHPVTLAHHDFVIEKILKQDPKQSKHRNVAKQIANDAMHINIPEFTPDDYIGSSTKNMLDPKFENILNILK